MEVPSPTALSARGRDKTLAVLHALVQLGPGAHKFRAIARRAGLDDSEVQRRLRKLYQAKLCDRPGHGYWQVRAQHLTPDVPGLLYPGIAAPLPGVDFLLAQIYRRTERVILLHSYSPITGERLCIATAGTSDPDFRRDLAVIPEAVGRLRQAPLDVDAPGLVILAHIAASDTPLRQDLRAIRADRVALSSSPLPGWSLISTPVRRLPGAPAAPGAEPGAVAAVSILAPEPAQHATLKTYGALLRTAVHAAVETTVLAPRRACAVPA